MRSRGRIIILSGPSGAGKTTLHNLLLRSPQYKGQVVRSISATTRSPRGQEKHGREYLFLSRRMFEYKIRTGQFLEWARVFDNYYGTPMKAVRKLLARGQHVLLCIDVQGARKVKQRIPEAVTIFVKTPTLAELKRRLKARGTDAKDSVALRLKIARKELKDAKRYDYILVNDRLNRAFARLSGIVKTFLG